MKKKILVIEDEPATGIGIQDQLESEGFEVRIASDGVIGLQSILKDTPDLVVLDLMLPGMSGLELKKAGLSHPV